MINNNINHIKQYFEKIISLAQTACIVTHQNPDGDGLSASIALYHILEQYFKLKVDIVIDSAFPKFLLHLTTQNLRYLQYNKSNKYDILFVLDCNEKSRIDTDSQIFNNAKHVFIVDHHVIKSDELSKEYFYYIDENAVSTGIMLHRFLKDYITELDDVYQKLYADCIYTTILNDTNNFINKNTDNETFLISAELMKYGLKPADIVYEFLLKTNISYLKFVGQSLATLCLSESKKIAYFYCTTRMLNENNLTTEAYSKMMKWTKGITDVEIQVNFQQYGENDFRVSLRSECRDMAAIAQQYGGGGHKEAAGFRIQEDLENSIIKVINHIESTL